MTTTAEQNSVRPSTYVIDLSILTYGLWTLVCQLIVNAGGSPPVLVHGLVGCSVVSLLLLGYGAVRWGPAALLRAMVDAEPALPPPAEPPLASRRRRFFALGFSLLSLATLWLFGARGHEEQLVLWAAPLFAFAFVFSLARDPAGAAPVPAAGGRELWLWPLALACGAFTLIAHRPDTDEAFYLAVATSLLRNPDLPVMGFDPVHGVLSWPLQVAAYRSHTFEPLAGALGSLTGVMPIYYTHMVFAGVAGALTPFAWMRLFRELWPARAGLCTVLTLVLLVADGSRNQAYGNFAMVRMFQGKAIMLTVTLPVISAYAIRFVRAPSRKRFGLLVMAQAAATGLSSIAIPLAPLVAGTAALAALPARGAIKRLSLSVAACLYPLGLGAFYYAQMLGARGVDKLAEVAGKAAETAVTEATVADKKLDLLHEIFFRVLSPTDIRWAYLLGLFLLPALGATPVLRRLAAVGGLLFFAVLANPVLQDLVAGHLFGPTTYWRVFWLLPLPAFVVALVVSVTSRGPFKQRTYLASGLAVAIVAWGAATLPGRPVFARSNGVTLKRPGLKTKYEYKVARRVSELTTAGTSVLAEQRLSIWLGAYEKPVYALFAKRSYLRKKYQRRRARLSRCVERGTCPKRYVLRALGSFPIGSVAVKRKVVARSRPLLSALEQAGFKLRERVGPYDVWTRPGP